MQESQSRKKTALTDDLCDFYQTTRSKKFREIFTVPWRKACGPLRIGLEYRAGEVPVSDLDSRMANQRTMASSKNEELTIWHFDIYAKYKIAEFNELNKAVKKPRPGWAGLSV